MMKHLGINVFAFACIVGLSVPCLAQSSPWNGTWKLDKATLKYDGPIISVATKGNSFVVSRYGRLAPNHICDGKHRVQPENGVGSSCTTTSTGYVIVTDASKRGNPEMKETVIFSKDGNSMTIVDDTTRGGTPVHTQYTLKRTSGGPGIGGTWKQVTPNVSLSDPGTLKIDVHGDSATFTHSDGSKPTTYKLDGSPMKEGQRTIEVKKEGAHTLKMTVLNNTGKPTLESTLVLSPDGHTIHEKEVTPEPNGGKTLVSYMTYRKQ